MHKSKWKFFFLAILFLFSSPLAQYSRCALERGWHCWFFSSAQEATNASFALMSDVFKRGLQCHPPWSSCEVAARVCGAIYSVMKCGDLSWFHIHLPFHTLVRTLVWARVPPTSTVLWLYVTANASVRLIRDCGDEGWLGDCAGFCHQKAGSGGSFPCFVKRFFDTNRFDLIFPSLAG